MGISLLAGWFPPLLIAVATATLAAAVGWGNRRWWLKVATVAAVAVTATVAVREMVTNENLIVPALPNSAYAWLFPAFFAFGVLVLRRRAGSPRRQWVAAPLALLLTTAVSANSFNRYYAYYPTVGSLISSPTAHQVSAAQVDLMRQRSAATAGLPRAPGAMPRHGVTFQIAIPGVVSRFRARPAWIYLPPAYFASRHPVLPVVMLLEGTPSDPVDWFRAGRADRTADRFAAAHHGLAPILVLPDQNGSFFGDSECVNRPNARTEDYLAIDVRNFMVARYWAPHNPSAWAVVGLSAGGTCAFDLALRHSNLFRLFGDFAGDPTPQLGSPAQTLHGLFGGSDLARRQFDPVNLLVGRPHRRRMIGFFEAGRGDRARARTGHALARLAALNGVRTRWMTVPGPHNFVVWGESFRAALDFFWPQFRFTHLAAPPQ
jgi:S-formylglutathione hydrolase FrmB